MHNLVTNGLKTTDLDKSDSSPVDEPLEAPALSYGPSSQPCLVIRPRSGWAAFDLREIWRYRDLLLILGLRDVKLRYRQTLIGIAWVILQPLLAAGIFGFVFGTIAGLPSEGLPYFVFAFAGLLGWNAFQSLVTKSSTCLVQSAHLISKVYFPRMILPISTILSTIIDFVVGLVVLVAVLPLWVPPEARILLVPFWLGVLVASSLGLGLLAGALMVRYRDVQYVVPVLIQLGMYASPVAYGVTAVPAHLQPLIMLNPLSAPLEGLRWSLLGTTLPPLTYIGYSTACAGIVLLAGMIAFKQMERGFADVI